MIRRLMISLLLVAMAVASASGVSPRDMQFPELSYEPTDPVRFETDNGMVVYFLEYHDLPVFVINAYFHGGDVYDPVDKAGLTGITATLMRTGGAGDRTADQVDEDLDFVGASMGSSSANDFLSVNANSLRKDADLVFGIFADALIRPAFDPDKLNLEASNLKEGIRRQNDNSWSIVRRVFYQTLYGDHPYGLFPTLASVDNIARDDVVAHHKRFYAPDNCILSITGDLTLEEAKALVERYLGEWEPTSQPVEPIAPAEKTYQAGVYYAEKDINQANIRFGHLGLDDKNPDRYAMELMNFALGGGGFASRLTSDVRTTAGLAYTVGSYEQVRPYNGFFFGYCLTRADAMAQATQMMLDIVADVKANGITAEELQLAKESTINSYVFGYDTPGELVAAKALLELRGFPPDQLKRTLEAYKAVTLEDCNRVAAKYLNTEDIVIVITGNKELFDQPPETFGPVTVVPMEIK